MIKNNVEFYDKEYCENFEPKDINDLLKKHEKVYCLTCKTWIYPWEIDEHKNHEISPNIIEDELVFEESYAGD